MSSGAVELSTGNQKEPPRTGVSFWHTLINTVKGNVGCGMLTMGSAFKKGGLLMSSLMVFVLLTISCYNQHILVSMGNSLTKRKGNAKAASYADTIAFAFDDGPPFSQKFKFFIKTAINFSTLTTQMGCCCVYAIFIKEGLIKIADCYGYALKPEEAVLIILPFILITSMIRNLKHIVPLSGAANISIFAAIFLILRFVVIDLKPIEEQAIVNWAELPLCFGNIVFAIEGITLILPLQQAMENKKRFTSPLGVLNITIAIMLLVQWSLGFFGYWHYGDKASQSLVEDLPLKGDTTAQIIVMALIFGILFTYTLQFHVGISIIVPHLDKWVTSLPFAKQNLYEYILRIMLALFTCFLTAVIPRLDLFVALVGAVGSTSLSFIFAPLGHLMMSEKEKSGRLYWRRIMDVVSLIIGLTGMVVASTESITEIINNIMKPS